MDFLGTDLEGFFKESAGDAAVQYVYYKYAGDRIVGYLKSLGKYADVGAAAAYGLVLNKFLGERGGIGDYVRRGTAATLGRAISVALGDPNITTARTSPTPGASGVPNYSTLAPVSLR